MRYRKLTETGDFQFGSEQGDFWRDQPEAVAQAVSTRLRLQFGDWYLDTTDGTDWKGKVLGNNTRSTRNAVIRQRVLLTPGVTEIDGYNSGTDPNTRRFTVGFALNTQFGKYGPFRTQFLTEPLTPIPQPPAQPISVTAIPTSDTSILVNWRPYAVIPEYVAQFSGVGGVTVTTDVVRLSRPETTEFSYEFGGP